MLFATVSSSNNNESVIIQTPLGKVEGFQWDGKAEIFLGIKYAHAPRFEVSFWIRSQKILLGLCFAYFYLYEIDQAKTFSSLHILGLWL